MKKFIATILSVLLMMSLCLSAAAADIYEPDDAAQVPVTLTVTPATFNVTVPTYLPISVDGYGDVTTASNVKIINNGHGSVKVTNMTVTPTGGWSIVSYDDTDMTYERVGTKKIALWINGEYTQEDGSISFHAGNFPVISGVNTSASDELDIIYDAMVPAQTNALMSVTAATVIFTIGWNT